jgi:hypothetical protein
MQIKETDCDPVVGIVSRASVMVGAVFSPYLGHLIGGLFFF